MVLRLKVLGQSTEIAPGTLKFWGKLWQSLRFGGELELTGGVFHHGEADAGQVDDALSELNRAVVLHLKIQHATLVAERARLGDTGEALDGALKRQRA